MSLFASFIICGIVSGTRSTNSYRDTVEISVAAVSDRPVRTAARAFVFSYLTSHVISLEHV